MLRNRLLASTAGRAHAPAYMLAGLIAIGGISPALGEALDEITVQARKRAESLQDIPVSGSAV
ncbi:MAG: hypothetical protein HXY25_10165 [Alphaproteobacteria bacterium]|nr:hypothetical protein [Alphaproteobacteria bacterium]